jgi:hypothetical protein
MIINDRGLPNGSKDRYGGRLDLGDLNLTNKQITFLNREIVVEVRKRKRKEKKYIHKFILIPYEVLIPFSYSYIYV